MDQLLAQGAYSQALNHPDCDDFSRGEILYWLGDPRARQTLRDTNPLAEARWCWQADLYQEGLDLLAGLPDSPEARVTKGLILLCQGADGPAEALLQEALPQLSGHRVWRAHYDLAVCYQFKSQAARAEQFYRQAADGWRALSPTHPELANSLFGLTGALQTQGSPEMSKAVEEFVAIAGPQDPRRISMLEALAGCCMETRDWQRAESILTQLGPTPTRLLLLGQVHFFQDRPDLALQHLKQAQLGFAGSRLDEARCLWMIGRIYRQQNNPAWKQILSKAGRYSAGDPNLQALIVQDRAKI